MTTKKTSTTGIEQLGKSVLRYSLVTNLVWIGSLKFEDYEIENISPLVTSSPLFSGVLKKLGEKKTAQLIGMTEIGMGALIAAKPLAPRASALGSLGAVGMFATTLSFMATTPGSSRRATGQPSCPWWGSSCSRTPCFWGHPSSRLLSRCSTPAAGNPKTGFLLTGPWVLPGRA